MQKEKQKYYRRDLKADRTADEEVQMESLEYKEVSPSRSPSKELLEKVEEMDRIADFKERIQYYNDHICSLAYSQTGSDLDKYGYNNGIGNNMLEGISEEQIDLFIEVRETEVKRLKSLIDSQKEYSNKLKSFIEGRAGQINLEHLKVYDSGFVKDLMTGDAKGPKIAIDLGPADAEEKLAYNQYLKEYVETLIGNKTDFSFLYQARYNGFDFAFAKEAFQKQMKTSVNQAGTLNNKLQTIEMLYNLNTPGDYMALVYKLDDEDLRKWESALFKHFINGGEYDYRIKKLTVESVKRICHVQQVFEFYKWLTYNKAGTLKSKNVTSYSIDSFIEHPNILSLYENNLNKNGVDFKIRGGKVKCAAFCLFLLSGKVAKREATQADAIKFAQAKYGIDIANTIKQLSRTNNKKNRERHIDDMERAAIDTKFGKFIKNSVD